MQSLSLQNLPVSTVRQLRKTIGDTVRAYIRESGVTLLQELGHSIDWYKISAILIGRLRNSTAISTSLEMASEELALVLERYLEQEIENLVAQIIPILSLDRVIADRVMATSAEQLEVAIQGIVKNELQAIVNLGGILGFAIGVLQSIFFLLR